MNTTFHRTLASLMLFTLTATLATAETIEDTLEQTLAFTPGSLLELSNTNGDVEIGTWDRNEIQIEARKRVKASGDDRARQAFEDLRVVIDESANGVSVETEYPKGRGSWWGGVSASVHYSIRVPREADLRIDTVNGKVFVEGAHGRIDLETTNGGVKAEDAGGSVTARTTNGSIDVELREISADEAMDFRTTNGSITLTLPSDVRADLSARTTNGSVHTDFPVTVQGTFRKNRLEGELNGGGATIELRTTNGSIRIREF